MQVGDRLGDRFELVGELGRGGMARVWLAEDAVRGEQVALKIVHPHLADRPSVVTRLRRELAAAGRVRHPGAWAPHDLHQLDGRLLLCMPLHPGATLEERVEQEGPFTADALVALARDLCEVLAAAHRVGVLHRDISPTNVMLDASGEAVLSDFGLARVQGEATVGETGLLGTPGYAAPECLTDDPIDPRADLYALGALLTFAATGTGPFPGGTPVAILRAQLSDERTRLSTARPDLPATLTHTVDALLEPEPGDRPGSAREVLDRITGRVALTSEDLGGATVSGPAPAGGTAGAGASGRSGREGHGAGGPSGGAGPSRPHLPPGPWELVLERRIDQAGPTSPPPVHTTPADRLFQGVMDRARAVFERAFGLQDDAPTPEERLTAQVSRQAGLPPEALEVSPVLREDRLRLVSGVDAATASTLGSAATEAGFRVHRHVPEAPATVATRVMRYGTGWLGLLLAEVLGLAAWATVMDGGLTYELGITGMFFGLLLLGLTLVLGPISLAGPLTDLARARRHAALPLAYGHDLRPLLAPGHTHRLAAPPPEAARSPVPQEAPASDAVPEVEEPGPSAPAPEAPEAAPRPGPEPLHRRVVARLETLSDDLDAAAARLPGPLHADLSRSVDQLTAEAERLGRTLEQLEATLREHRADVGVVEAALDTVQARLRRLETLDRAGRAVDRAELEGLRSAEQAHLTELEVAEDLDARRVRVSSRLLELSAVVAEMRRDLFDRAGPTQPLSDAVAQARREVAAGRQTLDELDRESARQRQRAAQRSRTVASRRR